MCTISCPKFSNSMMYIALFQLCIVLDSVFGEDIQAFAVSKYFMIVFFVATIFSVIISNSSKLVLKGLILPSIFLFYEILSYFWSFNQEMAFNQLVTQVQLYLLFLAVYLCVFRFCNITNYYDAIYFSGFCLFIYTLMVYDGIFNFINAMEIGTRMGGLISNQNTYGLVFANAAVIALYKLLNTKNFVHLISFFLFSFFSFSSGSKKGFFLIVIGIVFFTLIKYDLKKVFKGIALASFMFIFGWIIIQLPVFSTIYDRLEAFLLLGGSSSDESRLNMILFGLQLFLDKPFLGHGLNNYRLFYYDMSYSHNNYIEILVSLGGIGFAIYYGIFLYFFINMYCAKKTVSKEHNVLFFFVISSLIMGFGMVQFYSKGVWILLGVMAAELDKLRISNFLER